MSLFRLVASILLLVIGTAAKAERIAVHIHKVNNHLALEVLLSDSTKSDIETGPSECEKKGMRLVFLQVASTKNSPHAQPYGDGCWYARNKRVWIEASTFEEQTPFKLNFPTTSFKTDQGFLAWPAYDRYPPISQEQAMQRKQQDDADAATIKATQDYAEAIRLIESTIRCDSTPFPYTVMERLKTKGLVKDVSIGRGPLYAPTEDVAIFGRKLLFISGGGKDGSTEDFRNPPKKGGYVYIPTHFAITLDVVA